MNPKQVKEDIELFRILNMLAFVACVLVLSNVFIFRARSIDAVVTLIAAAVAGSHIANFVQRRKMYFACLAGVWLVWTIIFFYCTVH